MQLGLCKIPGNLKTRTGPNQSVWVGSVPRKGSGHSGRANKNQLFFRFGSGNPRKPEPEPECKNHFFLYSKFLTSFLLSSCLAALPPASHFASLPASLFNFQFFILPLRQPHSHLTSLTPFQSKTNHFLLYSNFISSCLAAAYLPLRLPLILIYSN